MNAKHLSFASVLLLMVIPALSAKSLDVEPAFRYRYQTIDDDIRNDATANTLKARLSVNLQSEETWQVFAQTDFVYAFNDERYNSIASFKNTAPIPDPDGHDLNQLWVGYVSDNDWKIKVGRQLININNQRHVSGNEFWQNDQTFDAASVVYESEQAWNIEYFFLKKAHRIFSDDARSIIPASDPRFDINPNRPLGQLGNHNHNSHLVNIGYQVNNFIGFKGYAFLLENKSAPSLSSNTIGIRLEGEIKPNIFRYAYELEFASQKAAKQSSLNYQSNYIWAKFGAQYKGHRLSLGYEKLGENRGVTFRTSLGNNHLFMGWSDLLAGVRTNQGLIDSFIEYRARINKLRWRLLYHQFTTDKSSRSIGNEIDFEVAYRYNREWETSVIASTFFSKGGTDTIPATLGDVMAISLMASYRF